MRWIWYLFLIVVGSLVWLTLFAYPCGGKFDWTIEGSPFYKEDVFFPRSKVFFSDKSNSSEDLSPFLYAISAKYHIYSFSKGIWEIRDKSGYLLATYESEGLPFFKEDRLFHVMLNNIVVEEIDLLNKMGFSLWKKVLPSSLISFSLDQGLIALGLSQGDVWILDNQGNLIYTVPSHFLEDSLILGVSLISYEGYRYLAFVEGLTYSFFSVYKLEEGNWNLIGKGNLGESLKREYSILFNGDESSFFTNLQEGVLSFNINSLKSYKVPIKGFLLNSFNGSLGGTFILSQEGDLVYLSQIYNSRILRIWDFCLKDNLSFEWLIDKGKSFLLNEKDSYFWVLGRS